MKFHFEHIVGRLVPLVVLLGSFQVGLAQFVDITAELRVDDRGPQEEVRIIHILVGTNSWQIDGDFCSGCTITYWYTGKEIIKHVKIPKMPPPDDVEPSEAEASQFAGSQTTWVYKCLDGNPSLPRSAPTPDRLDALSQIGWLAFCSGPYLHQAGREVFPPSSLWKELVHGDAFSDVTVCFSDNFGLPKSMDLYMTNSPLIQPVLQYRVFSSTNILGWQFPLEFKISQYRPAPVPGTRITAGTNGWEIDFTARGKVTAIGKGVKPKIPEKVLKSVANYYNYN
jgi:hypothetical protein